MKNVYGVNNPREEVLVIETPTDVMKNDVGNKKSAIYHPPVKSGKSHAQERKEYREKCGDVRAIKLGHPMDWPKFMALSDDTKREYLESVFSKYPGINARTICSEFNSCFRANEIKDEILRLGFNFDGADKRHQIQAKISQSILKEKQAEIEAAAANASKPKRVTYKQLRMWPADKALHYLQNLYDYYNRSLSLGDFGDLFSIGSDTMKNFMVSVGFDISSWGASRSVDALFYRGIFREEMLGGAKAKMQRDKSKKTKEPIEDVSSKPEPTPKAEKNTEKTKTEGAVEVTSKKSDVQISHIGIVVDASDIDSIAEVLKSFSGTVRIHIKKA